MWDRLNIYLRESWHGSRALVIQGATALVISVGLFYAALQLRVQRQTLTATYRFARVSKTLEYSLLMNPDIRSARTAISVAFGQPTAGSDPISAEEIETKLSNNPQLEVLVRYFFGHLFNLALAIKNGVADSDVAFDMVGTETIRYYYWMHRYIADRRERISGPYLLESQELILNDWIQRANARSKHLSIEC